MRVLLHEQWHGGHYDNYLNVLVPAVAALGGEVVLALNARTRRSAPAMQTWSALGNVRLTEPLREVGPQLGPKDRYDAARHLLDAMRAVSPDFTLLPSADAQTTGVALLDAIGGAVARRFGPIEGTLHYGYGYAAQSRRQRIKEAVYTATCRRLPFASVNFVNFAYGEYAIRERLMPADRIRLVGDPVPQPARIGRAAARQLLGIDVDGRYLGLIGSLDNRKAIPQLLAAFRAAPLARTDRLLLAGRLDAGFAALIRDAHGDLVRDGRLVVLDRYMTEAEIEHGYEALDLATVVYNGFAGLASLAMKAVAAGVPVLAHDFGWLRTAIRRFDLGSLTDIDDIPAFSTALSRALDAEPQPASEAVRRLLAFHTESNFVAQMTAGLRRHAGLPPAEVRSWPWVMEALPAERRCLF